MKMHFGANALLALVFASLAGCGKLTDDLNGTTVEEAGQQVGDIMASADEMGGSDSSLALGDPGSPRDMGMSRAFARLEPRSATERLLEGIFASHAYAADCSASSTFAACSGTSMTRTFGGCTIGSSRFAGSVALTWAGGATTCSLAADGYTITRVPSFTATGRRNGTLTVEKTGTVGQKLTRVSSGVFQFTNDGIRREFKNSSGTSIYDFTTSTTSAIGITDSTPATRAGRVMSAGTLKVTNNLTSVSCSYTPSAVTWTGACNCAVSGSWSGTCTDGTTSSVTITGCGTGTVVLDTATENISFDRCYSI